MRRIVGRRVSDGRDRPAGVTVRLLAGSTTRDEGSGAIRSLQRAELLAPEAEIERLWQRANLERLGRAYWRFLRRVTLGLVRVGCTQQGHVLLLPASRLGLLGFGAPQYELGDRRAAVSWRIVSGLLLARAGRGGQGRFQMTVTRQASAGPGLGSLGLEVELTGFHPAIAAIFGTRVYDLTQSRVHMLVTNAFLRSLARLVPAGARPRR